MDSDSKTNHNSQDEGKETLHQESVIANEVHNLYSGYIARDML